MKIEIDLIKKEFEHELFNLVIPFWEKHSIDKENGGYYTCLTKEGNVYDTAKYMWLHGRQIWMFSKLYNEESAKENWLEIAKIGMDFMRKNAVNKDGRVYFSLNEDGEPIYLQRKIFSECFYTIAMAEYGRAINSEKVIKEAKQKFDYLWMISKDTALVDRPVFSGETKFQTLAVPMILLNVIEEVYGNDYHDVIDKVYYCIKKIKIHIIDDVVYENVLTNGKLHDSSAGRLLNPGHAIEAGWFLKHWAKLIDDQELNELGTKMIRASFKLGWDKEHGGIFYFLDSKKYSPVQLEWNMKLWWPHCEAMYAFLLIYSETKDPKDFETFLTIKNYTFSHFSDSENGEWFGYLNREGTISMDFKGGPYKGCFHVPRSLYFSLKIINSINE